MDMAYITVIGLKVLILLLGTTEGIEPEQSLTQDYSIVAKVLQKFFNAYSASLRESRSFPDKPKKKYKDNIDKVIKLKIEALKPYLEDNSTIELTNVDDTNKKEELNNVTLEGDEETTIIEFIPQNDVKETLRISEHRPKFKDSLKKYRKMRDLIKNILIEESVSSNTQKLVINTLDSMLAFMVRSQCPANANMNNIYRERLRADDEVSDTFDLTRNWTKKWNQVREKYTKIWRDHLPQQPNPARKLFMFFEQIQDFLSSILNDSEYITNNYKVVCKLIKSDEKEVINFNKDNLFDFRTGQNKINLKCPAFQVCSEELEQFMRRLYRKLNETIAHTFRNYAAMYTSDINSDGSGEKGIVLAAIDRAFAQAKHKAKKIFRDETSTFELDHDRKADKNFKRLKTYVNDVIKKSLTTIKDYLYESVIDDNLKKRLVVNLKDDLIANTDVDLGNLMMDLKNEICRDFSACNGKMIRRNDGETGTRRSMSSIDKNKVYVKLQLTLDNELKKKVAKGDINLVNLWKNDNDMRVHPARVEVTRTTLKHHAKTHSTPTNPKEEVSKESDIDESQEEPRKSTRLDKEAVVSEASTEK